MRTLISPAAGILCFHDGIQRISRLSSYRGYYLEDVIFTINKRPYRVNEVITDRVSWLIMEEFFISDGVVAQGDQIGIFSTNKNRYIKPKSTNELEEELQRERERRNQEIKAKNEEIAQVRQELSEKNFKRAQQEHKKSLQRIQQQSPTINQMRPLSSGGNTGITQAFKDIFPEFDDDLF